MNSYLIDTNVILDLLAKRKPFFADSQNIFSKADRHEIKLVISSLSIANAYYMLSDTLKIKEARNILHKFKVLVEVHSLSDKIIELALTDNNFDDFEDAIQYYTAIDSECELIITRNTRDFKNSEIPVMKPNEFLSSI